jgi:hypothetical protein
MNRPRAVLARLSGRVWAAVGALVVIGSVALALVLSAGLQVWRGAVGRSAEEPPKLDLPPGSGELTVPPGRGQRRAPSTPTRPAAQRAGAPARPAVGPGTLPAVTGTTGGSSATPPTLSNPLPPVVAPPAPATGRRPGVSLLLPLVPRFLRLPLVSLTAPAPQPVPSVMFMPGVGNATAYANRAAAAAHHEAAAERHDAVAERHEAAKAERVEARADGRRHHVTVEHARHGRAHRTEAHHRRDAGRHRHGHRHHGAHVRGSAWWWSLER